MNRRIILLSALTVACVIIAALLPPMAQSLAYHDFADKRCLAGIPNGWNVLSNLPFIATGLWGVRVTVKSSFTRRLKMIYVFVFIGVFLVAFGSGYYHLAPGNKTLIYDRIPMAIVFMSLLAAIVAEFIDEKAGAIMLLPLILVGVCSVLYWFHTEEKGNGDLRFYGLVQFYPVLFIPLIMFLFPSHVSKQSTVALLWAVAWYVAAKILESFDKQVYAAVSIVSGHTLKHLAAAMSTLCLGRFVMKQNDFRVK